jgi:hypothetical protein
MVQCWGAEKRKARSEKHRGEREAVDN